MATDEGQTTSNYVSCDIADCGSTTFTYYGSSRGIDCPYLGKCSDYQRCCGSCRHNTAKRSYYEPEDYPYYPEPYYPWYPYYPSYPWYPTITFDGSPTTISDDIGNDLSMPTTSDTTWDNPNTITSDDTMTDTCYATS